jgi:flagellar motor switch protein FliM
MTVKPFHLKLAKVSSQQQELLRAVMSFLPKTVTTEAVCDGLMGVLNERIGSDVSFELDAVAEMTHGAFCKTLPRAPIVTSLTCVPVDKKAYLHVDGVVAHVSIERMLGGEHGGESAMRSLTDTEQGVLQYLILMLLERLQHVAGSTAPVHFRFDRFMFNPSDVEDIAEVDVPVTVLTYRIAVGERAGFLRIVLPNPIVEAVFLEAPEAIERSADETARERQRLGRFSDIVTTMWVEAGRTTLTPDELVNIERDDVVLFDESDIILGEGGKIGGRVRVRVGSGSHGGFLSEITTDKRAAHCRLDQSFRGEGV